MVLISQLLSRTPREISARLFYAIRKESSLVVARRRATLLSAMYVPINASVVMDADDSRVYSVQFGCPSGPVSRRHPCNLIVRTKFIFLILRKKTRTKIISLAKIMKTIMVFQ